MKNATISEADLRRLVRDIIKETMSAKFVSQNKNVVVDPTGSGKNVDTARKTEPAPSPTAATQYPSTKPVAPGARNINAALQNQDRPTVPAAASSTEREMSKDFEEMGLKNPSNGALSTKSPSSQKASMIEKILSSKGINVDSNALQGWVSKLDPSDAMIKTAAELASEYYHSIQ